MRRSNYWRDNYNPLRGLSIARLMALFEQAERGAFAETQLTLRKAEKRFPVLKGFVEKLLSSIEALDGKVRVKEQLPEGGTPELAEAQRKFLQSRYDLLKNFKTSSRRLPWRIFAATRSCKSIATRTASSPARWQSYIGWSRGAGRATASTGIFITTRIRSSGWGWAVARPFWAKTAGLAATHCPGPILSFGRRSRLCTRSP